ALISGLPSQSPVFLIAYVPGMFPARDAPSCFLAKMWHGVRIKQDVDNQRAAPVADRLHYPGYIFIAGQGYAFAAKAAADVCEAGPVEGGQDRIHLAPTQLDMLGAISAIIAHDDDEVGSMSYCGVEF